MLCYSAANQHSHRPVGLSNDRIALWAFSAAYAALRIAEMMILLAKLVVVAEDALLNTEGLLGQLVRAVRLVLEADGVWSHHLSVAEPEHPHLRRHLAVHHAAPRRLVEASWWRAEEGNDGDGTVRAAVVDTRVAVADLVAVRRWAVRGELHESELGVGPVL